MSDHATPEHDVSRSCPLTPVHPPEIPSHAALRDTRCNSLPLFNAAQRFRHGGWKAFRDRTFRAMRDAGASPSRLYRYRACGWFMRVLMKDTNPPAFAVRGSKCKDRFCVPCARERARLIQANLAEHVKDKRIRFLTLTVKHTDAPLKRQVRKLMLDFARLRRSRLWRRCVVGGVAVLEVKLSDTDNHWHPHLHCLLEGSFLPHAALRKLWLAITRDSSILDIRAPKSNEDVARYVCKYVTKPCDGSVLHNPQRLAELIAALHNTHLLLSFGTWNGVSFTREPTLDGWTELGDLDELIRRAGNGDDTARRALLYLGVDYQAEYALLGDVSPRPPPETGTSDQLSFWSIWTKPQRTA